MYYFYVVFDYTYIDINTLAQGINPLWPHTFGFKPLLGLEPMEPIRQQLQGSHANHLATETPIYMYVCMCVCMYLCIYVYLCVSVCMYL